jgi:hypothetical protein
LIIIFSFIMLHHLVQELPITMADVTSRHVTSRRNWFDPVKFLCVNLRESLSVAFLTPIALASSNIDTLST